MVTVEMSKYQVIDFRGFLRSAEGKDFTNLDDFFEFGKLRDVIVEAAKPIRDEMEVRVAKINEDAQSLRDAVKTNPEDAEAKKALDSMLKEKTQEEEKRLAEEMVSIEFADDMHKFLKDNFQKLFISKAASAEGLYSLAKALKIRE